MAASLEHCRTESRSHSLGLGLESRHPIAVVSPKMRLAENSLRSEKGSKSSHFPNAEELSYSSKITKCTESGKP